VEEDYPRWSDPAGSDMKSSELRASPVKGALAFGLHPIGLPEAAATLASKGLGAANRLCAPETALSPGNPLGSCL
jgi:hypothetical protein